MYKFFKSVEWWIVGIYAASAGIAILGVWKAVELGARVIR
jgi:hypothetical protein